MKINWQVRLQNPIFLIQLFCALLAPVLAYSGLAWEDMTNWRALFSLILNGFQNPVVAIAMLISVVNTITDPTTRGLGDGQKL